MSSGEINCMKCAVWGLIVNKCGWSARRILQLRSGLQAVSCHSHRTSAAAAVVLWLSQTTANGFAQGHLRRFYRATHIQRIYITRCMPRSGVCHTLYRNSWKELGMSSCDEVRIRIRRRSNFERFQQIRNSSNVLNAFLSDANSWESSCSTSNFTCIKRIPSKTTILCLKNVSPLICYNLDIYATRSDCDNFWQKCYWESKKSDDALFSTSPI